MSNPSQAVADARGAGQLSEDAAANLATFATRSDCESWERAAVEELIAGGHWQELNDRFFRHLRFGTGGLRGRTIGRVVTAAERGGRAAGRPERPAVGTNCLNYRVVADATTAVARWVRESAGTKDRLVIGYDSRWFSPEFARAAADTATAEGVDVLLFADAVSTPQLAFAVRWHGAGAGVMITASHNPPHDNGYKIYLPDGSQVVEPAVSAIAGHIERVREAPSRADAGRDTGRDAGRRGEVRLLDAAEDESFLRAMGEECLLGGAAWRAGGNVCVVYTPLHGTGGRLVPRVLRAAGVRVHVVEEQAALDGGFPTVASPNPEVPEAFAAGLARARSTGADAVLATDPDADRLGVAARDGEGAYRLLSGNEVSALLADFRLARLFAAGTLSADNAARAVVIKTFVTTDLIRAIAESYGVRCVETLTGFKYVGAKLRDYSRRVHPAADGALPLSRAEALASDAGTYLVLGCEESFGYLAGDYVRDKDANGAALMLAELMAHLADAGTTMLARLDALYLRHGYYLDRLMTLPFEGQRGASDLAALLASYRREPPRSFGATPVAQVQDFDAETILDADGEPLPRELMLRYTLADGGRFTIRGSGTEPKLKFYFSLRADAPTPGALAEARARLASRLERGWAALREDVRRRLASAS